MIDLGYIFRRAWAITWRHKTLWPFGFLVSLGAVGMRFGVNSSQLEQVLRELPRELAPDLQRQVTGFVQSPYFAVAVVVLVLLGLALGTGVALLGALGRAALVDQVRMAEDRDAVGVKDGWQAGIRHLWPVFLLRLLLGLPVALTTLAGALPVIGASLLIDRQTRPEIAIPGFFAMPLILLGCLVPAVCLSVLLTVPLSVLQRLAVRAYILEGRSVRGSLARAWALLRECPGSLALTWLGLLSIGVGVFLVTGLPLVLATMSLLFVALLVAFLSPWLSIALTFLGWLAVWLVGAAVNGVVETFVSAVWTLVYRELTGLGLTGEEAPASPRDSSISIREIDFDKTSYSAIYLAERASVTRRGQE